MKRKHFFKYKGEIKLVLSTKSNENHMIIIYIFIVKLNSQIEISGKSFTKDLIYEYTYILVIL